MYVKIAIFKDEIVAMEEAIQPKNERGFNIDELTEFSHRIARTQKINCNNSVKVEYFCRYVEAERL